MVNLYNFLIILPSCYLLYTCLDKWNRCQNGDIGPVYNNLKVKEKILLINSLNNYYRKYL